VAVPCGPTCHPRDPRENGRTACRPARPTQEIAMANKGQQKTKETKKPKKDATAAKPLSTGAVSAPITTQIIKRGKEAKLK
jgi:hypothetical protein